ILSCLFFTVALICVTSAVGVIHVTGYLGREVNVSCSYDEGYESYEKYLCKNDCGDSDVLITTSNSVKNKYTIHDDKTARIFTTTISDLHSTDTGKYWCGVTRTGKDIYTEVKLKLSTAVTINTNLIETHSSAMYSALYVLFAVPPVLLLLIGILVVVVYKWKHKVKGIFYIHTHAQSHPLKSACKKSITMFSAVCFQKMKPQWTEIHPREKV
uniref:Immunoglobulin V-set domain-containing protein n=1 Tax=Neolamprologus brichardi TaxID=32507 RepID=A0A3Q4I9B3_NEOBR